MLPDKNYFITIESNNDNEILKFWNKSKREVITQLKGDFWSFKLVPGKNEIINVKGGVFTNFSVLSHFDLKTGKILGKVNSYIPSDEINFIPSKNSILLPNLPKKKL